MIIYNNQPPHRSHNILRTRQPQGHEDPFRAYGIPEPSSSDVLIADGYAEGLGYASEIAVFDSSDGRTYAMVANGMATIRIDESDPYVVPAGIIFLYVNDPRLPVPAGIIPPAKVAEPVLYIAPFWTSDGHVHVLLAGEGASRVIDITNPGDPAVVAVFGGAAASEGPQDANTAGDGGPAGTAIRVGSDPE